MHKRLKRVRFIHRTKDGIRTGVWQLIDPKNMITIEHLWKDVNQYLDVEMTNKEWRFYSQQTRHVLPVWYHVDLLNDNDQILVEDSIQSVSPVQPMVTSMPIQSISLKTISKKKQLKTHITNRSFLITNKYSIPNAFYEQWKKAKHIKTQAIVR